MILCLVVSPKYWTSNVASIPWAGSPGFSTALPPVSHESEQGRIKPQFSLEQQKVYTCWMQLRVLPYNQAPEDT